MIKKINSLVIKNSYDKIGLTDYYLKANLWGWCNVTPDDKYKSIKGLEVLVIHSGLWSIRPKSLKKLS